MLRNTNANDSSYCEILLTYPKIRNQWYTAVITGCKAIGWSTCCYQKNVHIQPFLQAK